MPDKGEITSAVTNWFVHDEATARHFRQLRLLVFVTLIGLFLLWVTFFGWVAWRLGPGGYQRESAHSDFRYICEIISAHHPETNCKERFTKR